MKLVVGGVHQGKTAFAHTLSEHVCDDLHRLIREWMQSGEDLQEQVSQIEKTYADGECHGGRARRTTGRKCQLLWCDP